MDRIRNPKDFWAGALYLFVGIAAVVIAAAYPFGTATRMGPGYFPTILGAVLVLIGLASLTRAFLRPGEPIGAIIWRPLVSITLATILFGFLLPRVGLLLSLVALILVSAAASVAFKLGWRALLAMLALVAFCVIVFVELLGVPLPLLGKWLGG